MTQCNHLFRTEAIYAFYSAGEKHVVIVADVWLNPYTDQVHICPNPIAMPIAREFIVEGTSKTSGIHPMLLVKHRVTYSYASDLTPQKVVVWSQGLDAPARHEVELGSAPAPLAQTPQPKEAPASSAAPAPDHAAGAGPNEVVGFSINFDYKEALADALAQARVKKPPRNPDIAVTIEVKDVTARAGGNIKPGLFLTAVIK